MDKRMVKKGKNGGWVVVLPDGSEGATFYSRGDAFRASLKALEIERGEHDKGAK